MNNAVFYSPASVSDLLMLLKSTQDLCFIAGGTDLVIKLKKHGSFPKALVNLNRIKELTYIKKEASFICIGAMTTFTQIADDLIIKQYAHCLAQAASQVGSKQIRNIGTMGGNIANSAPCADSVTALMALNAIVKTMNAKGEICEKPIDEIVMGMEKNYLEPNEVILEIKIPLLDQTYMTAFGKLGSRTAVTISKLNMAISINCEGENEPIKAINVALGALGPKAFLAKGVQDALIGKRLNDALVFKLETALVEQVKLSIAGRMSYNYKKEAIKGLAQDVFKSLLVELEGRK